MRSALPPRGPVPMPSERPYTLGEEGPSLASAGPSTELTAVSRMPVQRAELQAPYGGRAEPMTSPRSAYAPARADDAIHTFMSGRGLY
jgi:hypothetical protein